MVVEYDADKLWIEIFEEDGLHYLVKYDWVVKYRPIGFNVVYQYKSGLTWNGNIKACKDDELDWNNTIARAGSESDKITLVCEDLFITFEFKHGDFKLHYYVKNPRASKEALKRTLGELYVTIKPTSEILRMEKRLSLIGLNEDYVTDGVTIITFDRNKLRMYRDIRTVENSLRSLLVFTDGKMNQSAINRYSDIDYIPILDNMNDDVIDLSACKNLKFIWRARCRNKTIILGDIDIKIEWSLVSSYSTIVTSNKAFYERYKHLGNIVYKE